jgi:hypothetical protein
MTELSTYAAFLADKLLAEGSLALVLTKLKAHHDRGGDASVLVFEDATGKQVEFDLRGTLDEVLAREIPAPEPAGRGRPKLGVVSREVSLLPRHWEWLDNQPSGNSAALRRLVDEARQREPDKERARLARAAASRVATALAGNFTHFEEAMRALFAKDEKKFVKLTRGWPRHVRQHLGRLLAGTWESGEAAQAR